MLVLLAASSLSRRVRAVASRHRARQARRKVERLPTITVSVRANYFKPWTSPSPDYRVTIHNADSVLVGTGCYALSPLNDQVYLFELEIAPEHRRCGYGMAFLWHLVRTCGQPITPVHERHHSREFWAAARRMGEIGLTVTDELRAGEMEAEARRWGHLEAQRARLDRLILERLEVHREPWELAVGRGPDA